ncbi:MAG: 1-(5-phosphoribosyl)-5-[(5-phosphoribosylamino)methylideneamino]imidazole-4-carboxamide isomerase [Dehalococcoidia bacterium]
MELIPAIDLRGGNVVRLHQGDYAQQTTFSGDPAGIAKLFAAAGVPRIHIVDLDGALEGLPAQLETVRTIAGAVPVPIEFGGGMRTAEAIDAALDAGIDRVVLGTGAVEQPELVERAIREHGPHRIVVGLDARDGMVAVSGWTEGTSVQATALMERMAGMGVRLFIYTDISRDGTLTEPNFEAVQDMHALAQRLDAAVIASGGIGEIAHLQRLAGIGVAGAIVGSAIYRGTVDLAEALHVIGGGA